MLASRSGKRYFYFVTRCAIEGLRRFTMINRNIPKRDKKTWWTKCEMSLIKEGLFIGTRVDASNLANAKLPGEKFRILTVDSESLQIEEDGILSKHVACMDETEADLLSFFDECSEFITSGLKNKQHVIVHW